MIEDQVVSLEKMIEVVVLPPRKLYKPRKLKKRLRTTPKKKGTSTVKNKPKKKSLSKYKKELDRVFSIFIRERDEGQCYTCPNKGEIKKMQAGHFVPRQYLAVRWDEVNVHCQCYACNVLYNGQPSAYAARLEKDYGPGTVEMLEGKRKILTKLKPEYYEFWIAHYTTVENVLDLKIDAV